jgi:hypothetical protein
MDIDDYYFFISFFWNPQLSRDYGAFRVRAPLLRTKRYGLRIDLFCFPITAFVDTLARNMSRRRLSEQWRM